MKISAQKIINFFKPNPLKLSVFALLIFLSSIFISSYFYTTFGFLYPAGLVDLANKNENVGFFFGFLFFSSYFLNMHLFYLLEILNPSKEIVSIDQINSLLPLYIIYLYILSLVISYIWVRSKITIYIVAFFIFIICAVAFVNEVYNTAFFKNGSLMSLTCKNIGTCPDGTEKRGVLPFCSLPPCDQISSFEECQKAGYPIAESYPRKCAVQGRDGAKTFTEEIKRSISSTPKSEVCTNQCGDKVCQQIVCLGTGCPCSETKFSCPQDCK